VKLKLNKDGSAVVKDGMPVYIHSNGREEAFDGPAAMKLAVGGHFQMSKTAAGLKIPPDLAAAFFGDSFRIEGGKLVGYTGDAPMYSHTRHGQAADFDEALGQLIDRYPNKAMILREGGAPAPGQPKQHEQPAPTVTRAQFDSMPPATRAKFMSEGGRIGDTAGVSAPTPAPAQHGGTINRAQFDALGPRERAQHFSGGGKITD
jgi:hypothetical protein